jgi:NAD(P)H dehydrogenase (quinone)
MKIAVTSASGKLGSAIVKQLIKEVGGENIIGIARTVEKAKHLGIEIRKGDYNDRQQLDKALEGVDVVLLVSGMDAPEKRIQQHRNVIEAARQNGVRKIVYTSIVGDESDTAFSPIVRSNRQTERDVRESGLNWAIGRNGIYIEPDIEYIDTYVKEGEIRNCAGEGKCGYTSRPELAVAYTQMLLGKKHDGKTYNLTGDAISQAELADCLNQVYGTSLSYHSVSIEAYKEERIAELGEFMGTVIAGIYEGIQKGVNDVNSDFEKATGRQHLPLLKMVSNYKSNS